MKGRKVIVEVSTDGAVRNRVAGINSVSHSQPGNLQAAEIVREGAIEEVPGEGWRLRREIRPIRLPDSFYESRRTLGGGEVRDMMPYEGAVAYVTDGFRYGIQYEDGGVDWLGNDLVSAFGEGAEIVEG